MESNASFLESNESLIYFYKHFTCDSIKEVKD